MVRFKVPAPPAKPIVVLLVLGWIVRVLLPLPETFPPKAIASVIMVRLFVLAAIVLPVVRLLAVNVVAPPRVTAPL